MHILRQRFYISLSYSTISEGARLDLDQSYGVEKRLKLSSEHIGFLAFGTTVISLAISNMFESL